MMASYTVDGEAFRADKPMAVAETPTSTRLGRHYNVHPDGERFVIAPTTQTAEGNERRLVFVFNFFDELRRLAPVR
jgi:hypothetical protein